MAEYRVIKSFVDLHDAHHIYHTGEKYPRDGVVVNAERIAFLASDKNKLGAPVIEKVQRDTEEISEVAGTGEEPERPQAPVEEPKPKRGRKSKNAVENL